MEERSRRLSHGLSARVMFPVCRCCCPTRASHSMAVYLRALPVGKLATARPPPPRVFYHCRPARCSSRPGRQHILPTSAPRVFLRRQLHARQFTIRVTDWSSPTASRSSLRRHATLLARGEVTAYPALRHSCSPSHPHQLHGKANPPQRTFMEARAASQHRALFAAGLVTCQRQVP